MTDRINAKVTSPRANLSLILGLASVALQFVGRFINGSDDQYEWIWYVMAATALAALAVGFVARVDGKIPGRAVIGMLLGAAMFLLFVGYGTGII
jgi:uncharacterized transporter YbjL